jgi:SAM-dependent methyltransferase
MWPTRARFSGDAFDVVIAGLVLHHVPDPEPAAMEMARAARPGAAVTAYVWDFGGERHFMAYLWQAVTALDSAAAALDPKNRMPICHPEPLAALFKGAGLRNVVVVPILAPIVFHDFDDYWQPHLLSGSSPAQRYVTSLDADRQTALREHLHTILPIADDGSIPLLGRLWAVRGTK